MEAVVPEDLLTDAKTRRSHTESASFVLRLDHSPVNTRRAFSTSASMAFCAASARS